MITAIHKNKNRILFFVILLLGIVLRMYQLGVYPAGLQRDEATVAMNTYNLFHNGTDFLGNVNPVYMSDWGDGHSALYVWLTLIPLLFNGGNMTPFVSRLPQAVIAILTLPAIYGIGKRTLGERLGLWAMFFTAVCPWHIMMARWGLDANLAPGFMMFSLYFFVRAKEKDSFLIPAGIFYGITLYSYACTWAVVPVTLVLEAVYFFVMKKIRFSKNVIIATVILFFEALPLMLFVLINNGFLKDIRLPFFTIASMNNFRGEEVANNLSEELIANIKNAAYLLLHEEGGGEPWEILKPWGLFYPVGRILIAIGGIWAFVKSVIAIVKKQFAWEIILLIQVIGASITCVVTYATMHRINLLFLPLVLCEAYAVYSIAELIKNKKAILSYIFEGIVAAVFVVCLVLFWKDYTGKEYKNLVEAYMGVGVEEAFEYSINMCKEKDIKMITVEKAAQWPKLVLYSETTADEFLENVVYETFPLPWSFTTKDLLIQTRIDYSAITDDSIYIIYFTDYDLFSSNFDMVKFYDWYVCVPMYK